MLQTPGLPPIIVHLLLTVHFEHNGSPMSFLLDIVEVAKSHSRETLATAFAKILDDFGIFEKVSKNKKESNDEH